VSIDWGQAANAYFGDQPHPRGHGLKIKEVAMAVKLASMAKFGGHASLHEAAMFWGEFAPGGQPIMSPDEFEHALERIAPVSYVFHGRPPTLREVATLKDKTPAEVHRHFGDLPDKHHPEISASNMVKAYQAARPWAREHLGREPVKSEAAFLHHSGEAAASYYARIKQPSDTLTPASTDVLQTQVGGNTGGGGMGAPRGQAVNQ
jgi:hypothetical protein